MSAETVERIKQAMKVAHEMTRLRTAFGMRSIFFYTLPIPTHIPHGLDAEEV